MTTVHKCNTKNKLPSVSINVESDQHDKTVSLSAALVLAFGSAAPRNQFAGFILSGVPRFQRKKFLLLGLAKASTAFSTFLPLITHRSCQVYGCAAVRKPGQPAESIEQEWNLGSGDEWKSALCTSAFFFGCFFGASVGGMLADFLGRRPTVFLALMTNAAAQGAAALAPGVFWYGAARAVAGAGTIAAVQSIYLLGTESAPPKWKATLGGFFFGAVALGQMALVLIYGLMSEFAPHVSGWRELTAIAAVINVLPAIAVLQVRESLRWLHAKGNVRDATLILQEAMAGNELENSEAEPLIGDKAPLLLSSLPEAPLTAVVAGKEAAQGNRSEQNYRSNAIWSLANGPLLTLAYLWGTTSCMYYGVSLSSSLLHGTAPTATGRSGFYVSATFSALADLLASMFSAWVVEHPALGRRWSTSALLAAGAVCFYSIPLAFEQHHLQVSLVVLSKFFLSAAYCGLYVFSSEMFEALVAGTALGICSSCARVGSILAPQFFSILGLTTTMMTFGSVALSSAGVCLLLPETSASAVRASAAGKVDQDLAHE